MIWRNALWLVALLVLAADARMQVLVGWQGDKDWLLLAAREVMEGKILYRDIFEVNPPLIVWLFTLPVWLSIHLPFLEDFEWLALIGLALSLLVAGLGMRLIRQHPAFAGHVHRQWVFGLLVAYTLIFFSTQTYFFDRDHVFFVLTFPYLLRFMPSLEQAKITVWFRVLIAVLAAVGFCIKPHTAIVFGMLQLFRLWRLRRIACLLNLENGIILAGAVIYLLCVWYFANDYIHVVLPMAMATYSAFNRRVNGYLFVTVGLIGIGLTFADFRIRHKTPYRQDVYYFITACAAFLIYALAGNGWGYTYNPMLCTMLFLSGWALLEYQWLAAEAKANGLPFNKFLFGTYACKTNLLVNAGYILLCIGTFYYGKPCGSDEGCKPDPYYVYIKEHQIHSFATMSVSLRRWTTLVRTTHAQWNSRFNGMFMLPQIMIGGPEFVARNEWIVRYIGNAFAEDLTRYNPDIVFVDNSEGIFNYPHPVDIPNIFMNVPQFARVWSGYHRVDVIDQCIDAPKKEGTKEALKPAENSHSIRIDCRFDIFARMH
jgi:hypothetical protein